jgi:hypothetical protein
MSPGQDRHYYYNFLFGPVSVVILLFDLHHSTAFLYGFVYSHNWIQCTHAAQDRFDLAVVPG